MSAARVLRPGPRPRPVRERLFARLLIDQETGCLLWNGELNSQGYGQMTVGSRSDGSRRHRLVHIVAWELEKGPVPEGMTLDHVEAWGCRHRHCANVAHLEAVTIRENVMRGGGPTAKNAAKTHCLRGHPFDQANTYIHKSTGQRKCRTCRRDRERQRYWEIRDQDQADDVAIILTAAQARDPAA